ncbi:M48 family metallopeptidase [Proteobacteria bacterium 005FR1]|nr:M48 family metallopeptidase [Proteobacteria bacterium 005FR1]
MPARPTSPKPRKPLALRVSRLTTLDHLGFDLTIKRSPRRRTLEIIIRRGEVLLMLPRFVSDKDGMAFVERKREWVLEMLEKQRQRVDEVISKQYVDGEVFHFLGTAYPLNITVGTRSRVELAGDAFQVTVSQSGATTAEAVQKAMWRWYKDQAMRLLRAKTDTQVARIKRDYAGIRLRKTKTKWGHCTASGVIQYNWQIMTAPEPVIDYLVAHEVSHLVHPNHSKRFWAHVERLCPDYKVQRNWLKTRGHTLIV